MPIVTVLVLVDARSTVLSVRRPFSEHAPEMIEMQLSSRLTQARREPTEADFMIILGSRVIHDYRAIQLRLGNGVDTVGRQRGQRQLDPFQATDRRRVACLASPRE